MNRRAAASAVASLLLAGCAAKPVALLPLPAPQAAYAPEIAGNPCRAGSAPVLVNYVTDRAPAAKLGKDGGQRFTGDRSFDSGPGSSPRADLLAMGHALACVDAAHLPGEAKTVKTGFIAPPTGLLKSGQNVPSLPPGQWQGSLTSQTVSGHGRVLIYVHGYNTKFDEAVLRAARLKQDLGFDGPVIAFSWPSRGSFSAFLPDVANARFAEVHFRKLFSLLPANSSDVAVIAHSLGNQIITAALADGSAKGAPDLAHLREVIMAAPAVDSDYLRMNSAPRMIANLAHKERITLYQSRNDRAMQFVAGVAKSSNAGDGRDPFDYPPIETIDASAIKAPPFGHSYFVDSPLVLADIKAIIESHAAPGGPQRQLQQPDPASPVWAFCGPPPAPGKAVKQPLPATTCPTPPERPAPAH